jgi:hypothetical protein
MRGWRLPVSSIVAMLVMGTVEADAGSMVSMNDAAVSATHPTVVLTDELFGGRSLALEVELASDRPERRAILVLFIDKAGALWQANLTFVIPGQTVIRTIAGRPDEVRRFAAGYAYDGRHLRLRASGDLSEPSPPLRMRWDLDIDEPVVDRTRATTR